MKSLNHPSRQMNGHFSRMIPSLVIADLQAFWTLQERLPTQYLTGTFETDVIIVVKGSEDGPRKVETSF
jgi:hypothetical protein